ncbi:hypothetical protein PPEP_a4424 [Pseudoalteromonas peptidolytica F12-50-A1]|uniref:Uncharacterized protein n=1 Tax=Pseudoalteromonas peptidolytica F12-50-A1 TaxID=1315280 RepID=A0A8I0T4T4_9GAMM|nr:hypothetical protein [Pseudoalteromonas peptidolytica F12-50-A1]
MIALATFALAILAAVLRWILLDSLSVFTPCPKSLSLGSLIKG